MANDTNHVVLIGNLTRDAELKFVGDGMAIAKFAIANNQSKKSGDSWTDEAHFFDIVMMGKSAEAVHKYLVKGKKVAVDGKLRQSRWTTDDGQNRSRVEVLCNQLQLLGGNPNGGESAHQDADVGHSGSDHGGADPDDCPF
jgi:single-strand DNA-binding protein